MQVGKQDFTRVAIMAMMLVTARCGDDADTETHGETAGNVESSPTTGESACGDGRLDEGELCDDGSGNGPGRSCLDNCVLNVCGDGDVGPDEECDDGEGNTESGACKLNCQVNVCGDGSVLGDVEECDDGNEQDGDGCDGDCRIESEEACPPGASVFTNEGFEAGFLAPWVSNGSASVISGNPHSGNWSVRVDGNFYVEQTLDPVVPVVGLASATFWSWHDITDEPAMLVEWVYDDETTDQYEGQFSLDGWQRHDMLDKLDPAKSLRSFRVWGYKSTEPTPDVAVYDEFSFCLVQ